MAYQKLKMETYGDLRRKLVYEIVCARREYFRLKAELASLDPTLPQNCFLAPYRSNHAYWYKALGHNQKVLPSAKDPTKRTKKLHLGRDENPKYRRALLEIELTRIYQVKEQTFAGIVTHLEALKTLYRVWQPRWRSHELSDGVWAGGKKSPDEKQAFEFIEDAGKETTFEFVKRQYYSQLNP